MANAAAEIRTTILDSSAVDMFSPPSPTRSLVSSPAARGPLFLVWVLLVDCETVPTATHNTTLSPASRALECGRSGRGYPTHVPDPLPFWHMPPGDFFYVAPHMVSATESVQILPLRVPLTLLPSVSLGSAKNFRGGPTWARRRAVLQASFSRAHRCEALSSALSRGSGTRDC